MAVSRSFEVFAIELFSSLGPVHLRRMFGGALAFFGEDSFALLADEEIYIRADELNESAFLEANCPKFSYPMKSGRTAELPFRRLPEEAMDDPDQAARFARLGLEAARRKTAAKSKAAGARRRR